MLVLALDTSTRAGSCALMRGDVVIEERGSDPQQSHAEHLPGDLIALLAAGSVALDAIDVFAVAVGPGSFTGLRVGIATMQGLAFATNRPLIGVSALDAMARIAASGIRERATESGKRGRPLIATWVDAWRGEVYAALYDADGEIEAPSVEPPASVLARLQHRGEILFIGDGAAGCAGLIRATLGDDARIAEPAAPLLAGAIARLAYDAARAGARPGPAAVGPLYVRRTDAELARDARSGR